ncbi:hypothetical protein BH10ACI3_BH10ACI3_20170 [soil metagenome]
MKRFLTLFILLFAIAASVPPLFAQKPVDAALAAKFEQAEKLFKEGDELDRTFDQGSKKAAIEKFNSASAIYRETGSKNEAGEALHRMARCYSDIHDNKKALEFYGQALLLRKEIRDVRGEARTLNNIGLVYKEIEDNQRSWEYLEQALQLYLKINDKELISSGYNNVGTAYETLGQNDKALEYYNRSLLVSKEIGDKKQETQTLVNIGSLLDDLGEKQKALDHYRIALPLSKLINDKEKQAWILNLTGSVYKDLGNKTKAVAYFRQSLAIYREIDDKEDQIDLLTNIGEVLNSGLDAVISFDEYNQALEIARKEGLQGKEAAALSAIAAILSRKNQVIQAIEKHNESAAIYEAIGMTAAFANELDDVAWEYLATNQYGLAEEYFRKAISIWDGTGDRRRAGSNRGLSDVYRFTGKTKEAFEGLEKALKISLDAEDYSYAGKVLKRSGRLYRDNGDPKTALEKFQQALPLIQKTNDAAGMAELYNEIGLVERALGNAVDGKKYFKKALSLQMSDAKGEPLSERAAGEIIDRGLAKLWPEKISYKSGEFLKEGMRFSREVKADDKWKHEYPFKLDKGQLLHLAVDQHGIDIAFQVADAKGNILLRSDRITGNEGIDSLVFVPGVGGDFVVTITPVKQAAGIYDLWVEALHQPTRNDHKRIGAEKLFAKYVELVDVIEKKKTKLTDQGKPLKRGGEIDPLVLTDLRMAERTLFAARELWRDIGDLPEEQTAMWEIYNLYEDYGSSLTNKKGWFDELVLITRITDDPGSEYNALRRYDFHVSVGWDKDRAIQLAYEALFLTDSKFGLKELTSADHRVSALQGVSIAFSHAGKKDMMLDIDRQSLAVSEANQNQEVQAEILENIGRGISTFDIPLAVENFEKAARLYAALKKSDKEAEMYANICGHYAGVQPIKTIEFCKKSLEIKPKKGQLSVNGFEEWQIGNALAELGKYKEALESYESGLRSIKTRAGYHNYQNSIYWGMGRLYQQLGNDAKALELFEKAKKGFLRDDERTEYAKILNDVGDLQTARKEWAKAVGSYAESLSRRRFDNNIVANIAREEAEITSKIANAQLHSGDLGAALKSMAEAERLQNQEKQKSAEVPRVSAAILSAQGKNTEAFDRYHSALSIYRAQNNRYGEAAVLSDLMAFSVANKNNRLGIFYGKQALNVYQAIRGNIVDLDKDLKSSYLRSKGKLYRDLAEVLSTEGRLAEAQAILDLLKEDEYFEFVQRDASEAKKLAEVSMTDREKNALNKYAELSDSLAGIGARFQSLNDKRSKIGGKLEEGEEAEYQKVKTEMDAANEGLRIFLKGLSEEFAKKVEDNTVITPESVRVLQANLRSSGNKAVLLTTYLQPERYRVIVTTGQTMIDRKVEYKDLGLTKKDVDAKIEAFAKALQQPHVDPRPLGYELYKIFVGPVEKDIESSGATTLLWSLDGRLRYIPIAALCYPNPDKSSDRKFLYLGEKYSNSVFTISRSTDGFVKQTGSIWQALGGGVSKAHPGFAALDSVPTELQTIIHNNQPFSKGIIDGSLLLDETFNQESFVSKIAQLPKKDETPNTFNVIHLATHFSLGASNADSYLLLGDGSHLSLDTIGTDSEFDFANVDLLTISACQTAVPVGEGSGREVEGLGLIAQSKGAKAILATLWPVADSSTALLMGEFYRIKKTDPTLTKSEALRKAQLYVMTGQYLTSGSPETRDVKKFAQGRVSPSSQPVFVVDPKAPFAHPFYWAPFILIGNWR